MSNFGPPEASSAGVDYDRQRRMSVHQDTAVVEVDLKIPGLTIRLADQGPTVINNSAIGFARMIEVPAVSVPDAKFEVPVADGLAFDHRVTRSEWHEERAIFIVSCKYPKPRISPAEYLPLLNRTAWTKKVLGA